MTNKVIITMEKIVSLCKRRGFIFPSSEIYGGMANSWDYGPLGVELKNNIQQLWWRRFVQSRDDMVGLDASLIMNSEVWKASGHLSEFSDPLTECKKCHVRFRADQILNASINMFRGGVGEWKTDEKGFVDSKNIMCPNCKSKDSFTKPTQFNLMLKTFIGPAEEQANIAYFRPEIAQAMFVNFKNVLDTTRKKLPFGIASQGKAFRNEITPGNFIFRTREFNLMELEYFVRKEDWGNRFEYWLKEMREWLKDLGINLKHVHEVEIPDGERAHYSKRTVDFEYDYPFGQKELYGLAYRTDYDLKRHYKSAPYKDQDTGEEFYPHVVEPTFGLDRSVLVALLEAYYEEKERLVLKLPIRLAPVKIAVFPLLRNKPELVKKAREIYDALRQDFVVAWDDRGNIGKRYYAQDEIGTPFCVTVDFDSLANPPAGGDVTVRDRDTMKQERVKIEKLEGYFRKKFI